MGVNKPKLNVAKLSEEDRRALEEYQHNQDVLQVLQDIAVMCQELINVTDDTKKESSKLEALGAVLTDSRNQLIKLNEKEYPELPDYSKPIIDAVGKLEKAIKAIDVKPQVNVAPTEVNVDTPQVNVDLKGVEKILKNDIPKAFNNAISLIRDNEKEGPDYTEKFDQMLKWLKDIDTGTRMTPQFPVSQLNDISATLTTINAAQPLAAGSDYDYLDVQQTDADTETYVFKTGGSGGTTVRTIVINYTDSTKADIDNVSWS